MDNQQKTEEMEGNAPRSRPYNSDYRPKLRNTWDDEPTTPGSVGLEVHAFILPKEKLLAWAHRNQFLPDEDDDNHRSSQAFIQIAQRLRLAINDDLIAILVGPPGLELAIKWAVLGTNNTRKSLNRALNPARIQKFKNMLGVVEEPLWYTGPFYWREG